jgi:hypothetical protein
MGGNVTGPVSSTDTAIARWNGTSGTVIQDSSVLIDGSDNMSGINSISSDGGAFTSDGSGNVTAALFNGVLIKTNNTDRGIYIGDQAGASKTTETDNAALGSHALAAAGGVNNTAVGSYALSDNTGNGCTAVGSSSLWAATSANDCVAVGENSLSTVSGTGNVAVGNDAGGNLASGDHNIFLGYKVANVTLSSGSNNILIGPNADTPTGTTSNYLNIGDAITGDMTTGPALMNGFTATTQSPGDTSDKVATCDFATAAGGNLTNLMFFGDGSDGNVTISSGTTTLTRDMYYNNLTLSGTGVLNNGGFIIFVAGTLDISAAPAGAILPTVASNGNAASGTNNSVGGLQLTNIGLNTGRTIPFGNSAAAGGDGTTTNGAVGGQNTTTAAIKAVNGGEGGGRVTNSGNAGAGSSGTGGLGGQITAPNAYPVHYASTFIVQYMGANVRFSGQGGSGGGSGGGDGTNKGGGGGSGALGADGIVIYANTINRGGSTAAGAIQGTGGVGGTGRSPGTVVTNGACGGGGGGGGGGGPWMYIVFQTLSGSTATNAIRAIGGAGGLAGNGVKNGTGTAVGGVGGQGGGGGRITLINIGAGTVSETTGSGGTAGSAQSAGTGGAGGAGATTQVNL